MIVLRPLCVMPTVCYAHMQILSVWVRRFLCVMVLSSSSGMLCPHVDGLFACSFTIVTVMFAQMLVVAPRGCPLPPPLSSPPVLRIDEVLPYLREFTHCWPYSVQVFHDACLERKILVANRCLKNAE